MEVPGGQQHLGNGAARDSAVPTIECLLYATVLRQFDEQEGADSSPGANPTQGLIL